MKLQLEIEHDTDMGVSRIFIIEAGKRVPFVDVGWSREEHTKVLDEIIRRVEQYNPWIPVSEGLPEKKRNVWVCVKIGEKLTATGIAYLTGAGWIVYRLTQDTYKVTHWKPIILPKQEKAGKDVFLTQEERVDVYHKSIGDKWDGEHWVSDNQKPIISPNAEAEK